MNSFYAGLFGVLLAGELEAAPKNQRMCVASGLDLDARGLGDDGGPFVPSRRAASLRAESKRRRLGAR